MAREVRSITFEEFSSDIAGFLERIIHGKETIVVEKDEGEAVMMKPIQVRKVTRNSEVDGIKRNKRAETGRKAFLSSAGSWSDVDTDKLIEDIYESRRISTRPPIKL